MHFQDVVFYKNSYNKNEGRRKSRAIFFYIKSEEKIIVAESTLISYMVPYSLPVFSYWHLFDNRDAYL